MLKKLKSLALSLYKMMKKLESLARLKRFLTRKGKGKGKSKSKSESETETETPMAKFRPFLFPETQSAVLPDPPPFFSPQIRNPPLPTNTFWQNFALKNGDQPEYMHPYLVKSSNSSLSISYPSRFVQPNFIYQVFIPNITISSSSSLSLTVHHEITSFDDLSLSLALPGGLVFPLVRGSPYITCLIRSSDTQFTISSSNAILSVTSSNHSTKHVVKLNNNQTWVIYSSSSLSLANDLTVCNFTGIIRIALLPDPSSEPILDKFSSCYPLSGKAVFSKPFTLSYEWKKKGWGELLLLAHPLHLQLLSNECKATVEPGLSYRSIDGDLIGVSGDSWVLRTDPIPINWHSIGGIKNPESSIPAIVSALKQDVEGLKQGLPATSSTYFYGKAIARTARLALIAEEVELPSVIPTIQQFLKDSITPWLEGNFAGNSFLYDPKWGGIVSKVGSSDSGADFGFGIYNDHHYHLGYFLYAIAVLAKLDPIWGRKFRPQAYSIVGDFMSLSHQFGYPKLRNFDLWKLHSWAGGLTEFADGRNQESTSEAINAYYSASLLGLAYGDGQLASIGSTLTAMEIRAAQTWWHVRERGGMYEKEFNEKNRVVGVLWSNKRDAGLWFAPPEWRECRLGIQVLPLLPVTEVVFSDVGFVRELVDWAMPALERQGVGEGWKGFVYALEGVYEREKALEKIGKLTGHDDGNSLSNLLWWVYSRQDGEEGSDGRWCWCYTH
ncbi:probable endo-1,3(4)-beta-glucanase ARB_01444 [Amborella trichopoda]|nr:probable endo-1,3(4)-beta-glucanase ARB_01444 [Amborella trichopoda]|eukprot:XP_006844226.3 probable endo-1,3(4)-beta-glucanase ARB_01444 [Amborella trichopoda]